MKPNISHILPFVITITFLFILTGKVLAQDFTVRQFRVLPNDITAYINPVRDLNDEACALIKVVGNKDFVFSSPLGIVKRRNDIGEIWIYLPKGSVMITIKHPQWGVLRDYRFPAPLESRMTYELILSQPLKYQNSAEIFMPENELTRPDTSLHVAKQLPQPQLKVRRPHIPWKRLILLNVGIQADGPSAGLRMAFMKKHGFYVLAQKDFHKMPHTEGECDRNGLQPGTDEAPYYTGHTEKGRWMLMAGGIHRVIKELCIYEGLGYGRRDVAWEQYNNKTLILNKDFSYQGISAEIGCLYRFPRLAVSAGIMTIQCKYWEAAIGIGINF